MFNDGLLHAKPATFGTKYVFKRIDAVLQEGTVGVIRVRVLQHTLQEKLVPAPHITEIPPGRHETVVR